MARHRCALALLASLAVPATGGAQAVQSATLRRAQQAYDNLEYRQVVSLAHAALRERLTGPERGHTSCSASRTAPWTRSSRPWMRSSRSS